jgi:hypothetical protein
MTLCKRIISRAILLLICALTVLCSAARASEVTTYTVTLDTSPLVGHPAGPFSILFALTDGSGLSDANTRITVTNVEFGGGNGSGGVGLFGGASGNLETEVVMTDSYPLTLFSESFTAGRFLRFTVSLRAGHDVGNVPDGLSFYVLDNSGSPIPTLSPAADYLVGFDLRSAEMKPQSFETDTSRLPSAGNAIAIDAATVDEVDE